MQKDLLEQRWETLHAKPVERTYEEPQEIRLKLPLGRPVGSMIECFKWRNLRKVLLGDMLWKESQYTREWSTPVAPA